MPAPDSLAHSVFTAIESAIENKTPDSPTLDIYSSIDDTAKVYTRNPSLWTPADLTCIPAASSVTGPTSNGVLVSPDILIQAAHSRATGQIWFVDNSNQVYNRIITGGVQIGISDLYVARLDAQLPFSISPAKIMPEGSCTGESVKLTSADTSGRWVPCVFTNQFRVMRIAEAAFFSAASKETSFGAMAVNVVPPQRQPAEWYSTVITGDSGAPVFLMIEGQLVAIGTWFGSELIPFISGSIAEINAAIASLGSSTALSVVDLGAFPDYQNP